MASDLFVRLVNLAEVLKEGLEASGVQLPADLTDEQLQCMTEAEVRQYYSQQQPSGSINLQEGQQRHPSQQNLLQLKTKFPAVDGSPAFKAWFPGLFTSRAQLFKPDNPTAVVLCFHSSGNAEDMFTSEGTGSRRVPSALLEACHKHSWQLLAPQLPGRAQRLREPPLPSLQELARELLPLVAPALLRAEGRYGVVGHSMGCWAAYELMLALRDAGLPDPAVACFSAMPWPHIPLGDRPWRQQKLLNEVQLKEECRGWDINEAVFSPDMWGLYQPMLRADFKLFDEYVPSVTWSQAQARPFGTTLKLFFGAADRRVGQALVQKWSLYTNAAEGSKSEPVCIAGNHLWPVSEPVAKAAWLQKVAAGLEEGFLGGQAGGTMKYQQA